MAARVTIISPELPPMSGGVGDYVEQLVLHWPRAQEFDFIIPAQPGGGRQALRHENVREVVADRAALAAALPARGAILLHYSAYGFDRYGYPRWLVDALIDWKRQTHGRLGMMLHEIWTFWPWWNKNFAVQFLHRRALGRLLDVADAVFTSTASQAEHLSALRRGVAIIVLPVGSNIIPRDASFELREAGTAVLFGRQPTRLRALHEMASGLRDLASAQRVTRVLTVGGGNSAAGDIEETEVLRSLRLSSGFEQLGEASAGDISAILATAEFGIAAQDPLSYTKSGTFMAYAAHSLNILSNYADPSAEEPMCLLISPAQLGRELEASELRARARKLQAWYERTASWPAIAQKIAASLETPAVGSDHR